MAGEFIGPSPSCRHPGCEKPRVRQRTGYTSMCAMHMARRQRGKDMDAPEYGKLGEWGDWKTDKRGYICRQRRCKGADGKRLVQMQHRFAMEQHLGRELLPGENVHHMNGDRTDNRIENLELWTRVQPAGQRVSDKVVWAEELLALYKPKPTVVMTHYPRREVSPT